MPRKRPGRATWFKMQLAFKSQIDDLDSKELGDLVKYAMKYFDEGEIIDIDNLKIKDKFFRLAFLPFKQSCDEALKYYADSVTNGKKAQEKNEEGEEEKGSPPIPSL